MALLAVVLLATAGIQSAAATALQATLDANWRGAYDILVTADEPAEGGLLAPNALGGSGDERIPLKDVARIRGLGGVEVAAPIAQIVLDSSGYGRIAVAVPIDHSKSTPDPQQYRLRVQYLEDDGLGERIALAQSFRVTLDDSAAPQQVAVDPARYGGGSNCQVGGLMVDCPASVQPAVETRFNAVIEAEPTAESDTTFSAFSNFGNTYAADHVVLDLPAVSVAPVRVTLIDPVAEQQLLGSAGAFLEPLVSAGAGRAHTIGELGQWSAGRSSDAFTTAIEEAADVQQRYLDGFEGGELYASYVAGMEAIGGEPRPAAEVIGSGTYIPVIVSPVTRTPLRLEVGVESLGGGELPDISQSSFSIPPITDPNAVGTPVGTISADVSGLLEPFATAPIMLDWPGSTGAAAVARPTNGYPGSWFGDFGRPVPVLPKQKAGALVLDSSGYLARADNGAGLGASGWVSVWPDDGVGRAPRVGSQSTYATVRAGQPSFGVDGRSSSLLPIAAFDADAVDVDSESLSAVPLGAYDPGVVTLVADADGSPIDPVEMLPSAGGLGLVGAQTAGIADIDAAAEAMQRPAVDAVRVRVSGVDRYDRAGIARVESVASAIEKLGLSATIVAGSSPQTTELQVDGYIFGTMDPGADQRVGTLGIVTEDWAQLGAAGRLGTGIAQATLALVASVVAATLALYAAVALQGTARRRREAATMRTIGWTRARILRWILAEQAPAVALIVVAAAAAFWWAGGSVVVQSAATGVVLGVVVITLVGAVLGSRVQPVRLASESDLLAERAETRPEVRWGRGVHANGPAERKTEVGPRSDHEDADHVEPASSRAPKMPRTPRKRQGRLGAESPAGFGARLVRGDRGGALWTAASVVVVMATTAALVLSLDLGQTAAGESRLAVFGAAQAATPLLALGLSGLAAGVLLVVMQRAATLRRRAGSRALLRSIGWTSNEIRRSERVEMLTVGLPSVLIGCYLLWFALSAAGLDGLDTAVSAALLAGLAVVAALLVTTRKAVA